MKETANQMILTVFEDCDITNFPEGEDDTEQKRSESVSE